MIKKWEKIKTQESYQCGIFYRIDKDRVIAPGGRETDYFVVRKDPSVVIIPLDKDSFIHMTIQHRYTVNKYSLELPSGHAENVGEKEALFSAKRELEEEMRMKSNEWSLLGIFDEANGLAEIPIYVFFAKDVFIINNPRKDLLDKNLHKSVKYKFAEIKKLISQGKITDATSITSLMIAEVKGFIN